jgi:molybdopterin-binding protein
VADACTIVIGAPDLLPSLKRRTPAGDDEVLAFSDADALQALQVISQRRPRMVALERYFAGTPRGAALINRIKADPALANAEIRVLSHEGDYTRVLPRDTTAAPAPRPNAVAAPPTPTPGSVRATTAYVPLDGQGTRRAARYRMAPQVEIVVDGNVATLVNLSIAGAQVVSSTILRPNQRVRMTLADDAATVRFSAAVAWAAFEIPPKVGPQYRAGLEFTDANPSAVDAFCDRHKDE